MAARTAKFCRWLLVIFLVTHGFFSKAQLIADFTAKITSGCAPIVVKFTDLTQGNPTNWKWDLGNGTISFLRNPSVTYFTPGQYNIKLVVRNSRGIDSIIKMQFVNVYFTPTINFSSSNTTGCFPLPVQFKDLSSASSGEIAKWQWDFGDGINSSDQNPEHTYKGSGNFNVSLRVTNSFGCVKSLTKPQFIKINTGVISDFKIKLSNSCKAPATINFINNSTGVGAINYQWDFGDGTGSTLINPSHIYTTNGSYTVRLISKNATGCVDTLTSVNAIILGNTNADFSAPANVCQESLVNLLNTSKPIPASMSWDFGDGTTSTDITPVKSYAAAGNYTIKMVGNFGACLDSISKPINVLSKPVIDFTADKTTDCKTPFPVKFTSNVTGAVSYRWDFGDSTSSTDPDPIHIYNSEGNYGVTLVATNLAGCSDTLFKPDYIQIQLPSITILNLPARGCAPFFFDFKNTVVSTEPVVSYQWDFGDGNNSASANPSNTYLNPGTYTVTVIITTASGCSDTLTAVNGVLVGTLPVANFNANPVEICANVPVNFTDLSTGKIDKWYWQFGDGGTSIEQNPNHAYQDTGYFNITLIVMNNGCADTITFTKYVHIKPPVAKYLVAYNCAVPLQRIFTDKSVGADTWFWEFGDSTIDTIPSPVHMYSTPGTYTFQLTVGNASTGCSYTKSQTILVIDEKPDFTVSNSIICKGTSVNFQASNVNPTNISSYFWNFGDGTSASSAFVSLAHVYKLAGTYSVMLITTDLLGCKDTVTKPLYIQVDGPTADFKPSKAGSCLNDVIIFTDSSFSDGVHDIKQWIWNYGDGKIETLTGPPFQHSYSLPGIFTVKLTVIDTKGCADSIIRINLITISKPVAGFNTKDLISCPAKPVTFINISTGPNLLYMWDFGDGSTSSQLNPVHQYAAEGLYSVSLSITDKYGCTDYIAKTDYIKIVNPIANFLMSDSISNCPPLVVNFTNTSLNLVSSLWDFGDGTTAITNNPSHFYSIPGVFNVTLKATGPGGCIDQKTRQIIVKGPYGSFTYSNIVGCNPLTTDFIATTKNADSLLWDFNDGTTVSTQDSILNHTYTNPGIYLPKIILTDTAGCQVPITGHDTIIVYGVQAILSSQSSTLCDSGLVSFFDKSLSNDLINTYHWNFGDGSVSNQKDPVHPYTTNGLYYTELTVTTQSGCKDSAMADVPIKIVSSPKIAILGNAGACVPATLKFGGIVLVADTSALSWLWNFGNGVTSTLQNPPPQIYPLANNYLIQLAVTNSSGCSTKVNKNAQAYPIPDVKIKADSNVCKGNTVSLLATGASTYTWFPATQLSCSNCTNPIAKPAISIKYHVKGTSIEGCKASDSISISVKLPFTLEVSNNDTLCAGRSTLLFAGGADKYIWSPAEGLDNSLIAQPTATPLKTTNYRVIGSDVIGCFKDTGFVLIEVFPIPKVNAGEDKTINVGRTIELLPVISSDVNSVIWSPTSGIFRNNYPGISVKPNESAEYTVEVANSGGCVARDRVTVHVLCNNANVFVPNTFSPNGDGSNDIFYPRGSGLFRVKSLKIFNRWGELTFEKSNFYANDILAGWDGTFKGQKLPPDVFVYTLDVVCDNNSILTFKGNIALVR